MFENRYDEYRQRFNVVLEKFCSEFTCRPKILEDSIKYSLNLGGKRFRPVLVYAVGDLLGVELDSLDDFALALELIHTYSLIHDDLPDMDNDDFRRGKPSNHKVFGNGNAILAGDGLLNTAYAVLFTAMRRGVGYIDASQYICDCAGVNGMIAGQAADLYYANSQKPDKRALDFIYLNKTAKLISAAVLVPSLLLGGKYFSELKFYGENLGILFQICDDILDVEGNFELLGKSIGKDEKEGKYTAIGLYGLNETKIQADMLASRVKAILEGIEGDTEFLSKLTDFVRDRSN